MPGETSPKDPNYRTAAEIVVNHKHTPKVRQQIFSPS